MSETSSKQTPKKVYGLSSKTTKSACRLCQSVGDPAHRTRLFSKANSALLAVAEELYGDLLPNNDLLPGLLCRPCERRLKNINAFKTTITQSQCSWERERFKRCTEVSPSVARTMKSAKTKPKQQAVPVRRELLFNTNPSMGKKCDQPEALIMETVAITATEMTESRIQATASKSVPQEEFLDNLGHKIDNELRDVARRDKNSILRERGYPGLCSVDFGQIVEEVMCSCPTVFRILSDMIQLNVDKKKNTAPFVLIYGIIMFLRCHDLSLIQRLNTILLTEGSAPKDLQERLSAYGFCLGATMKYKIQDQISNHFLTQAVELVKEGKTFVMVLDNIDWDIKVHDMRSDKQNTSVHAVATSIVFDRVSSSNLPDSPSAKDQASVNLKDLLTLTDEEKSDTRERYKIFIGQILSNNFPSFKFLKCVVPAHTPCRYEAEMSSPSVVVPLPVLLKDEKKYAKVIDIMDQLEIWVSEIYSGAGLCSPPDQEHISPSTPAMLPSRPDQPSSLIAPVSQRDDPLANVKIPVFGDQLTRVRLAGAKDLRAGSHTPQDRLDHLYPIKIVDWHTKRSFLKLIFKKLYKNSGREHGTLCFFREKLQRRNVTVDVKHFEDCEQFFLSVGKSFAVEALIQFFGMETKDDYRPSQNQPAYDTLNVEDNIKQYYHTVLEGFIDKFLLMDAVDNVLTHACSSDQDFIRNYSCLMSYYFLYYDMKDAVKEGNGERLATIHKILLKHFMSMPGYNAYAIEMLISVIQNEVFLSEAQAHQCIWAATSNWKGGSGKNIKIDLLQENRNKDIKKLIKTMGANKTDKAINRSSKAVGGEKKIVDNFDCQINKPIRSASHSHMQSEKDEGKIAHDLQVLKPFEYKSNRRHESFPTIASDPFATLNMAKFEKWLARHKKNLLLDAPLQHDNSIELNEQDE